MAEPGSKDLFLESLDRCTASKDFIPAFYSRFLLSSEEIMLKFKHTDFDKQYKMLERSLRLIAGATSGEPSALRELKERAESHDRYHLNIKKDMYELWKAAVLQTAEEYDPEWSDTVRHAWEKILDLAINQMVKSY